ncbi:hypothetical protein EZY14_002165 [Kordia sp. TARA_039_SRF]|nr:hypothetical protein EZY14_002165 [Kordia sp. TARA_039_SRF]
MLKKIKNLEKTQILEKKTQKSIYGGGRSICPGSGDYCPDDAAMIPVNCITNIPFCCVDNVWVHC